ncbi:MAG: hypothetical protein K0R14_2140 [Burkholderiales bacterium]|jgi:uncharacterized protein YciI|nr:hypothetical protein [Burkholderiales bacterium]
MKSFLILYDGKHPQIFNDALLKEHINFLKDLKYLSICGRLMRQIKTSKIIIGLGII